MKKKKSRKTDRKERDDFKNGKNKRKDAWRKENERKKEKQEREEQETHKQERERQFLEWEEQEKRQAKERKRREKEQQLEREKWLLPGPFPSVTNHQEDGGRGDEEETEDDDLDWLTKLSEIQEKCAGCCFLVQQVLKIQTELEKELARKQYKGKLNTVVATPTLSQGITVCPAYKK